MNHLSKDYYHFSTPITNLFGIYYVVGIKSGNVKNVEGTAATHSALS